MKIEKTIYSPFDDLVLKKKIPDRNEGFDVIYYSWRVLKLRGAKVLTVQKKNVYLDSSW